MHDQPGDSLDIDVELIDRCFTRTESIAYQALDVINARLCVLYHILTPTEERIACRHRIIAYLQAELHRIYPNYHIISYGSFVTRIFLPDGDVDLAIVVNEQNSSEVLAKLYNHLKDVATTADSGPFNITNVSKIQAETSIIRLIINGIFVDISATRPTGLVTSLYIALLNDTVGRNDLLKRSILLIQAWCLYEAHILGSHSQMLNSYALRVMTVFIVTSSPEIVHPLQVLFKFLAFYSTFDFNSNTVTAFGILPNSTLDGSNPRALYDYLFRGDSASQSYIKKETLLFLVLARNMLGNVHPELAGCLRHFTPSPASDSQGTGKTGGAASEHANVKAFFRYLARALELTRPQDVPESPASFDAIATAARTVIRCPVALARIMPFSTTLTYHPATISIMDPVYPVNNLGKATSAASFARIKAAFRAGYLQLGAIMMMICDNTAPLSVLQAEFDLFFVNTFTHFEVDPRAVQMLSVPDNFTNFDSTSSLLHVSPGALYHELLNVMILYLSK